MKKEFQILAYQSAFCDDWNNFIRKSTQRYFQFERNFMEYHQHSFVDASLMVYHDHKLVALLPANRKNDCIESHGGLTFGGLIYLPSTKGKDILAIFQQLMGYFQSLGIKKWKYKAFPTPLRVLSNEADLYALYRCQAKWTRRDFSTLIDLTSPFSYSSGRNGDVKKALKYNYTLNFEECWDDFWEVLNERLMQRHQVAPIHSLREIKYLKEMFPERIKLIVWKDDEGNLAGCVIFEEDTFVHIQYMTSTIGAAKKRGLDLVLDYLIQYSKGKGLKTISFGHSCENEGNFLNEGLSSYKESFGGVGMIHDFYEIEL